MGWSNLNPDMLGLIASKVKTLEDFIRLGAVCSKYRSVLIKQEDGPIITRPHLPWLMLPCDPKLPWSMLPCDHDGEEEDSQQWQCRRSFSFSMIENKVHHIKFQEPYRKKFVGSSHGWLVMVDTPTLFLLNPLKNQRRDLPPVTTMPGILDFNKNDVGFEYTCKCVFDGTIYNGSLDELESLYPGKVILSKDPEEEDCIAVALCGDLRQLVFCKIGDTSWTQVEHELRPPQCDVVHANRKFYVVNISGKVGIFDVNNPKVTIISKAPVKGYTTYLTFDTTGALLLIKRLVGWYDSFSQAEYIDNNDNDENIEIRINHNGQCHDQEAYDLFFYRTKKFTVFKLDEEKNEWNKVKDIGDNMVFLGDNHSICYSSNEFSRCNKNSIYFTDDYVSYDGDLHGGHDIGIFSMDGKEDGGSITRFPCFKDVALSKIFPRPIWFTPSLGTRSKP